LIARLQADFVITAVEQLGAIKKILANISAKGEKPTGGVPVYSAVSEQANARRCYDPSVRAMAEHVQKRYELHACNAVDFDDLADAAAVCRTRGGAGSVPRKYRYVMADTPRHDATQFQLVHLLTRNIATFCVWGHDQRTTAGVAEIGNLDLEKHYPRSNHQLEQITVPRTRSERRQRAHQAQHPRRAKQLGCGGKTAAQKIELRSMMMRKSAAWSDKLSLPAWRRTPWRTTRFCSGRTSSRGRWKPRCARPAFGTI
jgi:hypothetical protein